MVIKYFENDCVTILADPEKKLGIARWRGFISGNEFKELTQKCVDLITQYQVNYWLADNRNMKAIRQQDQLWFSECIVPQLLNSSLSKMATLVSTDLFNRMAIEQIIHRAEPIESLKLQDFDKEENALAWLGVQEKTNKSLSKNTDTTRNLR